MKTAAAIGAVALVLVGCVDSTADCASLRFDSERWKAAREDVVMHRITAAEEHLRETARDLASCGVLTGWSERRVISRLGRPTSRGMDDNPRLHLEFTFLVGFSPSRISEVEDHLHLEFDDGRVVYASAPPAERGEALGEDRAVDGEPVGGGPVVEP